MISMAGCRPALLCTTSATPPSLISISEFCASLTPRNCTTGLYGRYSRSCRGRHACQLNELAFGRISNLLSSRKFPERLVRCGCNKGEEPTVPSQCYETRVKDYGRPSDKAWQTLKQFTASVLLASWILLPINGHNSAFARDLKIEGVEDVHNYASQSSSISSQCPSEERCASGGSTAVLETQMDYMLAADVTATSKPASEIDRATESTRLDCTASSTSSVENEGTKSPEPVTNESVVQEAWDVVNENFLDARRHSWSSDDWLRKKEDVMKRPFRSRMAAYGAIRGMLATLNDPYTRFLTPDQFLQLSKYDVTGIGLNIGEAEEGDGNNRLKVLGIVIGSPAQLMGVRQGDELLAVNGSSVQGLSAFEAASLIQGPKGTPVSIQIRHGLCEDAQEFTVPRQQDVRTPVFYRLEHTQNPRELTGYIRLREFNALAKRDLVVAMKRLQDAGATSFLLDLQDNPGGLVQAGIEIARLFLDGGETVIQTVGRDPSNYKNIVANGVPLTKAPLTVLVNDHTASASEIVAAALHDNCRAILVGNRTFGKGLIQSVYELSDGSGIILTVGKYVTPGHHDIDGNGIEPDFKHLPGTSEATKKLGACTLLKNDTPSSPSL